MSLDNLKQQANSGASQLQKPQKEQLQHTAQHSTTEHCTAWCGTAQRSTAPAGMFYRPPLWLRLTTVSQLLCQFQHANFHIPYYPFFLLKSKVVKNETDLAANNAGVREAGFLIKSLCHAEITAGAA